MTIEQFSNFGITTLRCNTKPDDTVIQVVDTSNLPTQGNFALVVQQLPQTSPEIMIATAVSKNSITVLRGQEGTTPIHFGIGATVAHTLTARVMKQFLSSSGNPTFNYLDFNPVAAKGGDQGTMLQNFLLDCQLQSLSMQGTGLDDQIQSHYVNADIPDIRTDTSVPIIVPQRVNLRHHGKLVRVGSSGVVTNFYTGDTTSRALANRVMPTLIVVPGAHCDKANIYCNSNGSDNGSGLFIGKNWTMYGASLITKGTGFSAGDILTVFNPSLSPYSPAKYTIDTVDNKGGIATFHLSQKGAYALPPVLQKYQWTPVNGFPTAFDSCGNLSVLGGTGSGASFGHLWLSDWGTQGAGGGNTYSPGASGLITNTQVGDIVIAQSSHYLDGTYGATFDAQVANLNHTIRNITTVSGSSHGISFINGADTRVNILNTVDPGTASFILGFSSLEVAIDVIDTPSGDSSVMYIDNSAFIDRRGEMFKRNLQNASNPPAAFSLGAFSSGSNMNQNVKLDYQITQGGAGGNQSNISTIGCPVVFVAYSEAFELNFNVTNRQAGYSGQYPLVSSFVKFGNNVGAGVITGQIDQAFGSLISGVLPSLVKLDILDTEVCQSPGIVTATITGTPTTGDTIAVLFTNSMLSATYNWPRNISYSPTTGETTTQVAAAIVALINSDALLSISGVVTSNLANVITIGQMGQDANSTVASATIGGNTNVSFGNSGQLSGSISGGRLITGGIYDIVMSGVPTSGVMGTGFRKAGPGSKVTDDSVGGLYINQGTAASPLWTLFDTGSQAWGSITGTLSNQTDLETALQNLYYAALAF